MTLSTQFNRSFVWSESEGVGICIEKPISYDSDYFSSYVERDKTAMGLELTKARVDIVDRYHKGLVVDVGIGGGGFVNMKDCYGYDVSELAIEYLLANKKFINPREEKVDAVCFWDSLEHIENPSIIINNVSSWVFVSMPIYKSMDHCLNSKHFKPGEHIWYFTESGLIKYMESLGFECCEVNNIETLIGREDIKSFAFKRVSYGWR